MADQEPDAVNSDDETDVEVALIDIDGDGTVDAAVVTTADAVDIDGDGQADMVTTTEQVAVDLDGDGEADLVQTTTTVLSDVDGDGLADVVDRRIVTEAVIDGELEVVEEVEEEITVLGGTAADVEDDADD